MPLEEIYDARALRVVIDDEDGRQQARFAPPTHTGNKCCEQCACPHVTKAETSQLAIW